MRTILVVVALILAGSLVLNGYLLWDKKQAQKERFADNSRLNEVITSKQAEILKADTLLATITQKSRERAAKDSALVGALKGRVSGLRLKLAELGEITPQEVADTTCARLIQVSQLKDSVIAKQDDLISTLELTHAAEIREFTEILSLHQQKFTAQQQISEAWMETAAEARKDAVKEKRRKNLFKITSGILVGAVVWIGVRE